MQRLNLIRTQLIDSYSSNSSDIFSHVTMAPPDPILGTAQAYRADKDSQKMNLGVGAYMTEELKPYVFKVVKQVESELLENLNNDTVNKNYLPIEGNANFRALAKKLIFGQNSAHLDRITTLQTLSGTGSLRVGFEFLKKFAESEVYLPKPTWGNHFAVLKKAGLVAKEYPYYNPQERGFDLGAMLNFLKGLKAGSIILLHPCAHNPTGVDPLRDDWTQIAEVMLERKLLPYFDSAYQGFATGDLEKDAYPIRLFADMGFQMVVSQSFAKNMGMYGERIGALHIVCQSNATATRVLSQIKLIVRPMYSNPPIHGALVAERVLGNQQNFTSWTKELKEVAGRIIKMRYLLREHLEKLNTPGTWNHITDQIGMFSFTGLNPKQCEEMIGKYHIYMLKNGRISMSGINTKNVEYLAKAINNVVRGI